MNYFPHWYRRNEFCDFLDREDWQYSEDWKQDKTPDWEYYEFDDHPDGWKFWEEDF